MLYTNYSQMLHKNSLDIIILTHICLLVTHFLLLL